MWGHLGVGVSMQAIASLGPPSPCWLCCPSCFPNMLYFIEIVCKTLPPPPTQLFILQQGSLFVQDLLLQGGEEGTAGGSGRGYMAGSCHF